MAQPRVEGEGPWEVRWSWTTGYSGVDRLPTVDQAIRFCDELLRRTTPPTFDVRISARNRETGEGLRDHLIRVHGDVSNTALDHISDTSYDPYTAACGTCGGSGKITIIQTGKEKKCTRCDGTGKE